MPFSKRSQEGYLLLDHRASPGLTGDLVQKSGLGTMPLGEGSVFESATITCSHCQRQVVLNPDRSRSRGYCPKCDHYVCDTCEVIRVETGQCRTYKQIMDEFEQSVLKGNING